MKKLVNCVICVFCLFNIVMSLDRQELLTAILSFTLLVISACVIVGILD